ncbi:hypothetical protein HZB02_02185 [Candidatus Woesearchaeota archaeon]|nr:hypothetical protein [Candidatus Woesearchaeota archaeon]
MPKNSRIFVRVTNAQHERVRNNAEAMGYLNVSDYLRSIALERTLVFQEQFSEVYEKIVGTRPLVARKRQERPLHEFF